LGVSEDKLISEDVSVIITKMMIGPIQKIPAKGTVNGYNQYYPAQSYFDQWIFG
jgi:hypothetical protein